MQYKAIKESTLLSIQDRMKRGETKEEAEGNIIKAAISLFKQEKIGFIDLKYVYQILEYDYAGEIADIMNDLKKAIRTEYGLNEIVHGEMKAGKSEEDAKKDAIRLAHESYRNGDIENVELLDMILWSLGYRLKEETLLADRKTISNGIAYECDD